MTTKISILTPFRLGVGLIRDAECLFGYLHQRLLMFSDYTKASFK